MNKNQLCIITGVILLTSGYHGYFFVKNFIEYNIWFRGNWRFFLEAAILFAGMIGAVLFLATKFRSVRLLRAYMCFIVVTTPFAFLSYKTIIDHNPDAMKNYLFIISMVLNLAESVCAVIGLWFFAKRTGAYVEYENILDEQIGEFTPSPGIIRFLNRFFDALMIVFILYTEIVGNLFFEDKLHGTGRVALFFTEIGLTLFYYFILEGFFNITIGKCITGTTIVSSDGSRPSAKQRIGRTFCRLIPFEPFSFFNADARGWHDSYTGTYVVRSDTKIEFN